MLQVLSFDLWFTIFQCSQQYDEIVLQYRIQTCYKIFQRYGLEINYFDFAKIFNAASKHIDQLRIQPNIANAIDFSAEQHWEIFVDFCIQNTSLVRKFQQNPTIRSQFISELSIPYSQALKLYPPQLTLNLSSILDWANTNGYKCAMISNTGKTPGRILREILRDLGIAKKFDVMIFSDEVKLSKPNIRIFQMLVDQLDIPPTQILHIGDNIVSDVEGANKAGFYGALYNGQLASNYLYKTSYLSELHQFQPKYIINDWNEMPRLIEAINRNLSYNNSGCHS